MQWKISQLIFNEQKQEITVDGQRIKLESIASQVLHYLCQHQNSIISREELIKHVWQGQVVTDNAVNRVIARLRKALNDDAKNSEFIVTVPKKGYRLIASATKLDDVTQQNAAIECEPRQSKAKSNSKPGLIKHKATLSYLIPIAITMLLTVWLWQGFTPSASNQQILKVEHLTRYKGAELDAALSPNQNWLIYSRFEDNTLNMYLLDLATNQQRIISDRLGNAGGASWSADGQQVVYLYSDEVSCQYRIKLFKNGEFTEEKVVYNCPVGSFGKVIFDRSGEGLIFSQRQTSNDQYYIYHLDLNNGKAQRLKQPTAYLAGHSQFDLHPTRNSLLVSSPDEQLHLVLYELELDNETYVPLFSKRSFQCCAIWSHDGRHIVMMGPHPASQLEQYHLNGELDKVIVYSSQTLSAPQRIQNGKDYMFTAGFLNSSLYLLEDTGHSHILTDANAEEYLPDISNDGKSLAYISNQSGQEQVWIRELDHENKRQLSHFDDHHKYFDLRWSPDKSSIALLTIRGLRLVDTESGKHSDLLLPEKEIRGLSWVAENRLSFSLKIEDDWRAHHYDINSHSLKMIDKPWRYVSYHTSQKNLVVFSKNNEVLINGEVVKADIKTPSSKSRRFAFSWLDDRLYYQRHHEDQFQLIANNINTATTQQIFTHASPFDFSVFPGGSVISVLDNAEIDVLITQHP